MLKTWIQKTFRCAAIVLATAGALMMFGSLLILVGQIYAWARTGHWPSLLFETPWLWLGRPLPTGAAAGILTTCFEQETSLVLFVTGAVAFLVGSFLRDRLIEKEPKRRYLGSLAQPTLDETAKAAAERMQAKLEQMERCPDRIGPKSDRAADRVPHLFTFTASSRPRAACVAAPPVAPLTVLSKPA